MQTLFSELTSFAREAGEAEITGEVRAITGITLTAVGLERVLGIGERCIVHGSDGPVHAEVVGLGTHGTELLPFGSWRGVAAGDRVEVTEKQVPVSQHRAVVVVKGREAGEGCRRR